MIPYDDLVAALSAWRARQGLPVNSIGGGGSGPTPSPGSGPHANAGSGPYAQPGSGPYAQPGSGPNRAAPPSPPPSASRPGMQVAPIDEEVEEVLDEAAYENEGSDFAMPFNAGADDADATSIGGAPERPTEADLGRDKDDW